MISLKHKVVIVTGASRGIGRAIAQLFAQEGAQVVLAARRKQDLSRVEKEIQKHGGTTFVVQCDVSKENSVKNLIKKTVQKFKRIDILINNAGIGIHKPIIQFTAQDWDTTLDTNLKGPFFCTREVLPIMIKQ